MKGENLQSRTFYLARLSFRFDRDEKFYRQAKAKNSAPSNHLTGSIKGTSLKKTKQLETRKSRKEKAHQ